MPSLYFKVESDLDKVIKLREEIRRLKSELSSLGANATSREIRNLEGKLSSCKSELDRVISSTVQYNNELRKTSVDASELSNVLMSRMGKALSAIGGITAVKNLISDIIRVRGEFQAADTAIQTLLGSKEKADELMAKVRQYATISPLEFSDVTKATQMMLGFNIEAEKVPGYLQAIGDVSMGDTQRFNSLVLAFSQMSAAGKLMGQDLNQMINAGFNPLQTIAEKTGKSIATLKDEMSKGAVSAEMVQQAFIDATSAGGKFYQMSENAAKTINGQLSMLQDSIDAAFNEMGKQIEGVVISGIQLTTKLISNYKEVGQIIAELVAAYGTYKAALIIITALQRANAAVTAQAALEMQFAAKAGITLSNAEAIAAAKTKLLQAAQLGLVRALKAAAAAAAANPYVLMAAAVTALGYGVYKLVTYETQAERQQKKLNTAVRDFHAELAKERISLDSLFDSLKRTNEGSDERKKLIRAINDQYGQYLPNLLKETSNLNEINAAYSIINDSLRDNIALRMKANALESVATDGVKTQMEALDKLNKSLAGKGINSAVSQAIIEEIKQTASDFQKAGSTFQKAYTQAVLNVRRKFLGDKMMKSSFYMSIQDYVKSYFDTEKAVKDINRRFDALIFSKPKDKKDNAVTEFASSATEELKKATDQAERLKKEIADLRSGKSVTTKQGETVADLIEAKEKELKQVKDTIATLTGQTEKEATKAAAKEAKEQIKIEEDLSKELAALQADRNQLSIDLMQDGYGKRLAEIEASYDREIATIRQKTMEWKNEQSGVLTSEQTDYVAEALRQTADKRLKLIDQLNAKQTEAEQKAMNDFLAEWGTYEEKREAIRQQYLQKMSEADTEGLRMSLQKEMEKALSDLDFKQFQKSISWDRIFGNLGTLNTSTLKSLRDQLKAYFDLHQDDTPENLKLIRERLEELDREIANSEKVVPKLKRLIETFKEAKDATQRGLLSKEQLDLIASLSDNMDKVTGVASSSMTLAETLGINLPDGISKAVDGLNGLSSGLRDIASGNVIKGAIGMVTGLVNVFKGVGSVFTGIFGSSNREWETLNDRYTRLNDVWNDIIDAKKEYMSISWGEEINATTEQINKLYEAQQAMAKAVAESRLKYRKTGDHSVGYNMWNGRKQFEGYAWKNIAGEISSQLGIAFSGMESLISLTTDQYQWIMMTYPEYIAMLDDEFRASLDDIHQISESMDDVIEQAKEQLTGISFQSVEDDFLSKLMDMDSSSQDFAENFEKYLQKAILGTMVADKYRAKLRAWYDAFAGSSADGINVDEYKELQQQYSEIVESAIEERERLKDLMGWVTEETATEDTASDNSLKGAYAKASQESIDLLAGQTGALRVSVDQIRDIGNTIRSQMDAIYTLQQTGWDNVRVIREVAQQVRSLTEQVADNTAAINGCMVTIQGYSKRQADALESTLSVKVKM